MKLLSTLAITTVLIATPAHAFWDSKKSEADVFGNTNVTVSAIGDNGTLLRAECGSDKKPRIALLIRSYAINKTINGEMLFKSNTAGLVSGDAELGDWNDDYIAAVAEDIDWISSFMVNAAAARKPIPVGFQIPGTEFKVSDTFTPRGSTKAANFFLDGCKLGKATLTN